MLGKYLIFNLIQESSHTLWLFCRTNVAILNQTSGFIQLIYIILTHGSKHDLCQPQY